MIGGCSPDSRHGRPSCHHANVACSCLRYINKDVRNHNNQTPKRKTWTREDNHLALQCYFRSNPSQRGYRKRMIEIWQECAKFQRTSQRIDDQVRTIIKKGWVSDLQILEIHPKTQKQNHNTVPLHQVVSNKYNPTKKRLPTSENENTRLQNNTQPRNHEETLSQEQKKKNLENVKRIMNSEKATLPSLRNIE